MHATVTNFRATASATINLSGISLVAGHNGNGKTSTLQAISAALTGEPIPIEGITKAQAGMLVRSGTASGSAVITSEQGTAEVSWPAAKVKTTGAPPCASKYATGLASIVTMPVKERTAFLIDYLRAQPTKQQFMTALADMPIGWVIPKEVAEEGDSGFEPVPNGHPVKRGGQDIRPTSPTLEKLWELITAQGWDATHDQIKEKGAKLKGSWETVTNAGKYGATKAAGWLPTGYAHDLDAASEDALRATVTDARDALEAAIAASAVDDSKRAELQALADLLPERQSVLDKAKEPLAEEETLRQAAAELQTAQVALAGAKQELQRLRDTAPKQGEPPRKLYCTCGKELMLDPAGNLCEYSTGGPTQQEIDAHAEKVSAQVKVVNTQEKATAALQAHHDKLAAARQDAVAAWNQRLAAASAAVTESANAARHLEENPAAPAADHHASVEDCRNDLAAHELRLSAFIAKREATRLHDSIEVNAKLLACIAPGGIRADALQHALGNFNTGLWAVCDMAGWPRASVESDFSISYAGSPYFLISRTQQWMVRTLVLITMAMREQAPVIVIDDADFLTAKADRNKLFGLLRQVGIPAVVGMAMDGEETVPRLGKAGWGASYWIGEGGVAREVV